MRAFLQAVDTMNVVLRHVVGAMLGVMVLVVALQIVVRFVLPRLGFVVSAPWSEEVARYLMIWCIFLGAAVACRSGALIGVDTLPDSLPEIWGDRVRLLALTITIGFFVLLMHLGWRWVEFGETDFSTVMSMQMKWVYLSLPLGSLFGIVNIVAFLAERRLARHESLAPHPEQNPEITLV